MLDSSKPTSSAILPHALLEPRVTRAPGDPFRRDALSKPVRLLEKYKAHV